MLVSLKQTGKNVGREFGRSWSNLSDGWRELLNRSGNALIHFSSSRDRAHPADRARPSLPRWSLLAAEVEETDTEIVVRVEMADMEKKDCHVAIEGSTLYLSGEKHFARETGSSTSHVMERAYGSFRRAIPLPRDVDPDKAEASYKNGVLCVRLPKRFGNNARTIALS